MLNATIWFKCNRKYGDNQEMSHAWINHSSFLAIILFYGEYKKTINVSYSVEFLSSICAKSKHS